MFCLRFTLCLALLMPGFAFSQKKKKQSMPPSINITENGTSRYTIIIPANATPYEQKAAAVLQDYLMKISGAALPVISSDKYRSPYEIVLGQNERIDHLSLPISYAKLKEDGFTIVTDSSRLIIAGGNEKGTLYGVYSFLEKYLGCRMYTPKVKITPKQKQIILGKINDQQVPVI